MMMSNKIMRSAIKILGLGMVVMVCNLRFAQAGTIGMSGQWDFDGASYLYDPIGIPVNTAPVTGHFNFDGGTVGLDSLFFGITYHADGTISDQLNGTYYAVFSNYYLGTSYDFSILWEITDQGDGTASVITLDSDGDGLAAVKLLDGPNAGFSYAINGTLTAVPIPAAAWLFGSGLLGLTGMARRNKKRG